jgi:glycosyltransferase involved in cell wall biosynthesis
MKILFVLEHYYPYIGGAENLFQSLAESLFEKGHTVTVCTTRFDKSLPEKEQINGVNIFRVNVSNRFQFTFFATSEVYKLALACDIVHTTSYNAALPAFRAAKAAKKKCIITFHEVWGNLWYQLPYLTWIQKRLYARFEKMILNLSFDRFVAVSGFTADSLQQAGIDPDKITMIYNGIDYSKYPAKSNQTKEGRFVITYFGRLGASKGLDLLLKAIQMIDDDGILFRLILPTKPKSVYKKVSKQIRGYKIENKVELLHELSKEDLLDKLLGSACVVIPSYSEGFCFTAAESVAMHLPVISSGKGALKEVVSGKYIEMESQTVEGLTDAIKKAVKNEWTEIPVRKFELEESVSKYLELYESLANKKAG